MSDKKFYLVNVIPSNERRFCFFFIEIKKDGYYSYKISHYYPTNIKKKVSIRLIQSLPFNYWFQCRVLKSSESNFIYFIFNELCYYFMVSRLGTTYNIQEITL